MWAFPAPLRQPGAWAGPFAYRSETNASRRSSTSAIFSHLLSFLSLSFAPVFAFFAQALGSLSKAASSAHHNTDGKPKVSSTPRSGLRSCEGLVPSVPQFTVKHGICNSPEEVCLVVVRNVTWPGSQVVRFSHSFRPAVLGIPSTGCRTAELRITGREGGLLVQLFAAQVLLPPQTKILMATIVCGKRTFRLSASAHHVDGTDPMASSAGSKRKRGAIEVRRLLTPCHKNACHTVYAMNVSMHVDNM